MRNILMAFVLILAAGCARPAGPAKVNAAATATKPKTAPFLAEIQAFEKADRLHRPPDGGIVFVGSSTFRMWKTMEADMKPLQVLNRGFGGSQMEHAILYADRIVIPYKPAIIVVYEGGNDLAEKKTPEHVMADFKTFTAKVLAALPQTRIYFLSVRPSISRANIVQQERRFNAMLQAFTFSDPRLRFIDITLPMYDVENQLRTDVFIADKLHLNAKGYGLITPIIKARLMEK